MKDIRTRYSSTLTVMTAILAALLLLGNHLQLQAFGGEGITQFPQVEIDGHMYARGADYTFTHDRAVQIGSLNIHAEAGTEIILEDTRAESTHIKLLVGRTEATGSGVVQTGSVQLNLNGQAEIIHFSWLSEAEITVREGETSMSSPRATESLIAPAHIRFNTKTGTLFE